MNDKKIIIVGLVIFVLAITFPLWFNLCASVPFLEPELSAKAKSAKVCVQPAEKMRANHMTILNEWRNFVVRDADRIYTNDEGHQFKMSLSSGEQSCLGCHDNKEKFCDRCHNYASVDPYCWDCHIDPKEKK